MTDDEYSAMMTQAYKLGEEAGKSSGSWLFDGNTDMETYRCTLKMIDDGDPALWDYAPNPLSGEYADDPTADDILSDLDVERSELEECDDVDQILDEYQNGFSQGWSDEVERVCRYHCQESNQEG